MLHGVESGLRTRLHTETSVMLRYESDRSMTKKALMLSKYPT